MLTMIHARPLGWDGPPVICDLDRPKEGKLLLYRITADGDDRLSVGMMNPSPRILVADELLYGLFIGSGMYHPSVTLQRPTEGHGSTGHRVGQYDCESRLGSICYANSLLRFDCIERTLVYKISEYVYDKNAWWAQWPD